MRFVRLKYAAILLGAMTIALSGIAQTQNPAARTSQQNYKQQSKDKDKTQEPTEFFGKGSEAGAEQVPDSVKKKERVKRPLESYFFSDTVRSQRLISWNINTSTNEIRLINVDTMQTGFQLQYPYLQDQTGDAYLGNLGGASVPLSYFRRTESHRTTFTNAYDSYLKRTEDVRFFNVKKPFTQLGYIMAGQTAKLEEDFTATHAQSVTPELGFNLDYHSRGARGVYAWQTSRNKSLSMAMQYTGKRYTMHAGYVYNMLSLRENGGLIDDRDVKDSILNYDLPSTIPMKLKDARNLIKNNSYFFSQSFGIPFHRITDEDFTIGKYPAVFIGHEFEYNRWWRKYTDTYTGSYYSNYIDKTSASYYDNWFINPTATRDSTFESSIENRVYVQIQPWNRNGVIGVINAGFGADAEHFYQFGLDQYLNGNRKGVNKMSYYAYGSVDGRIKKYFDWQADLRVHPFGYRAGEASIGGSAKASVFAKGKPISLSGYFRYSHTSPGYWEQQYYSNHFIWDNNFGFEDETRFGVGLDMPIAGLSFGFDQSVITGKIYYDENCLPQQHSKAVSLSSFYLREDLALRNVHLNHRVQVQMSSDQTVVPVPLVSAYLSYFYEFNVVKGVLKLQVGIDGHYNTPYYGFGYNPGIAQFYNQRTTKVGNYVYLDAFVTAKWKRMRILLKYQHWNENLWGRREYFTVAHYPLNPGIFKVGISWTFYD